MAGVNLGLYILAFYGVLRGPRSRDRELGTMDEGADGDYTYKG
jgi:hypothetical protein